ncbi:DUF924 domain-containing protein [Sphingomonas sinipercae]|uniref:DUF924 domain-containing protein n=1 Tax=Sphingomonas sinipercae TaxID=2714944 RepID=A0A6G7ZKS4_9SPHN|nr:DUF924 family protein [Sphingomonas sinipercae]QIL01597.1 DUF924 domain-containing protein [Sphingomonas sinipercae]
MTEAAANWRADVLNFWFGLGYDRWFGGDPELDEAIADRFQHLWAEQRQLPVDSFLADPRTALAAVILFDQFPRNMFRGSAEQFATDHLALQIAKAAVARDFDDGLSDDERAFLYLPFQHSEDLDDQRHSLLLVSGLKDQRYLPFAQKHHDVIERFGRFPHRNAILGRSPRPDEIAAGDVVPW